MWMCIENHNNCFCYFNHSFNLVDNAAALVILYVCTQENTSTIISVITIQLQTSALRYNSSSEWTSDGGWIEIQYTTEDHLNDAWVLMEKPDNVRYWGWIVPATGKHIWHGFIGLRNVVIYCDHWSLTFRKLSLILLMKTRGIWFLMIRLM